jgi:hypothetical protein
MIYLLFPQKKEILLAVIRQWNNTVMLVLVSTGTFLEEIPDVGMLHGS